MEWTWQGTVTEAKLQGGVLETPVSIHSNRRKQHVEADSAIGTALTLVLGLALRLAHDTLAAYMNHWKKRAILQTRTVLDAVLWNFL